MSYDLDLDPGDDYLCPCCGEEECTRDCPAHVVPCPGCDEWPSQCVCEHDTLPCEAPS
jgi:hypothetical protein